MHMKLFTVCPLSLRNMWNDFPLPPNINKDESLGILVLQKICKSECATPDTADTFSHTSNMNTVRRCLFTCEHNKIDVREGRGSRVKSKLRRPMAAAALFAGQGIDPSFAFATNGL